MKVDFPTGGKIEAVLDQSSTTLYGVNGGVAQAGRRESRGPVRPAQRRRWGLRRGRISRLALNCREKMDELLRWHLLNRGVGRYIEVTRKRLHPRSARSRQRGRARHHDRACGDLHVGSSQTEPDLDEATRAWTRVSGEGHRERVEHRLPDGSHHADRHADYCGDMPGADVSECETRG
jgi:hypothetical protein